MNIKKPVVTEKTVALASDNNQYTFEVATRSTKGQARVELEKLFGVKVIDVKSSTRLGKAKRAGVNTRRFARRSDRKIMVFKLKDGQKIDIFTK